LTPPSTPIPSPASYNEEFTGERVIPGKVDVDLWNDHISRYAFASRLARSKRVLDLGCGAGYGSAELAKTAGSTTGVDIAPEAVAYAREHYRGIEFLQASATATGLPDASFDLITAFEVIEHLSDWRGLLAEAKRLLAPGGQFLVSTPNRDYYTESRGTSGANPFHEHEFSLDEFRAELLAFFPSATILMQNHVEAISFQPMKAFPAIDVCLEKSGTASHSHFFLAICGEEVESRAYLYVPAAANILRERELHIAKLDAEIASKERWLEQTRNERDELHRLHQKLEKELEEHNRWALSIETELEQTRQHIQRLQQELQTEQAAARQFAADYEAKVAELEMDVREKTAWAQQTEERLGRELQAKVNELAEAVRLLDRAEATVEERTRWAQDLEAKLALVRASRWVRLGRKVGVGPVA
jgi:SAM-dependent methyltransferase